MIFLGADHRGFNLKEKLKKRLNDAGFEIQDLGNANFEPGDDYVLFAQKVAEAISQNPDSLGVLLCGSGAGVDIVANKVKGIRSALVFDVSRARQAREHENANVLSLPADTLDEDTAWEILTTFLNTKFSGAQRHIRRLEEMKAVEDEN